MCIKAMNGNGEWVSVGFTIYFYGETVSELSGVGSKAPARPPQGGQTIHGLSMMDS